MEDMTVSKKITTLRSSLRIIPEPADPSLLQQEPSSDNATQLGGALGHGMDDRFGLASLTDSSMIIAYYLFKFPGLRGKSKRLFWVGLGAVCWVLWTTRNKFTIEGIFPAKPADLLFKISIFLQQWKFLSKPDDRDDLEVLIAKVRESAISLSPPAHV